MAFGKVAHDTYDSASSATVVLPAPAGIAANDILFGYVKHNANETPTGVPSGWTLLGSEFNTESTSYWFLYYKIATGSEPADYTWTFATAARAGGVSIAYRDGFDTADPIDAVSDTGYITNDTTLRAAAATAAEANAPVLFFGCTHNSSANAVTHPSSPAAFTEDVEYFGGSGRGNYEIASLIWTGSGTTGNVDATLASAVGVKHAFLVILTPNTAAPPTVTDVDTDEILTADQTAVAVTGTDMGANAGARTFDLVQGAVEVEQSQGSGNATGGAFDVTGFGTGGLLAYGVATDFRVTTGAGSDTLAVTINPPADHAYVDLTYVDSDASYRIEGTPTDIEAGDQIEYDTQGGVFSIDENGVPATTDESVLSSTFRIQDGTGWGAAGTVTILLPIVLSPTTLPNATEGVPYTEAVDAANGDGGPYTFAVIGGALPAGLTLGTDGTFSGSPSEAGEFSFTVEAEDASYHTGERAYTLTVDSAPTFAFSPDSLPRGTIDEAYAGETIAASGGTEPYTYAVTAGALPAGITLSTGGALSGTPTETGTFGFTVGAEDYYGFTGSRAYTLVVDPATDAGTTPTVFFGVSFAVIRTILQRARRKGYKPPWSSN